MPPQPIVVSTPNPLWPSNFIYIANQLITHLESYRVPYTSIEHIGSTSIPNLSAKPNIDIVILVPDHATALEARDALMWEPSDTEYYKHIGDGGIRGRMSMKFQDRELIPRRSVYIIAEDCEEGMLSLKGYRALKKVLLDKKNEDLKKEYEDVKVEMVEEGVIDGVEYGRRKNAVIARILMRAGWSEEEVKKKEALDTRVPGAMDDDPY